MVRAVVAVSLIVPTSVEEENVVLGERKVVRVVHNVIVHTFVLLHNVVLGRVLDVVAHANSVVIILKPF